MHVVMMTKEYPPEIYDGTSVHVTKLTCFMRGLDSVDVDVHYMGAPRDEADVYIHGVDPELKGANASIKTLFTGLHMANAAAATDIDVVHSHAWYSGLGGHLTGLLKGIPHVVTTHSLEPHRPWKREQLGGGHDVSSWSECNAMGYVNVIITVSTRIKDVTLDAYPRISPDKIHVALNDIDTELWYSRPTWGESKEQSGWSILGELGVDPSRPMVAFVDRTTRRKGVAYLIKTTSLFDDGMQLVLRAGAPDTPEIVKETEQLVHDLREKRDGISWVQDVLPRERIQEILTAADSFVCPPIYEPLGIVNLETMACGIATVASDVDGIPEIVVDGETGTLIYYDGSNPEGFEHGIATAVNNMVADRDRAAKVSQAGKRRAEDVFSWENIAEQTVEVYKSLI